LTLAANHLGTDYVGALAPGPIGPFSLRRLHWSLLRALEPLRRRGVIS
jgi:hypothetical protein